jgi:hypothetical protein
MVSRIANSYGPAINLSPFNTTSQPVKVISDVQQAIISFLLQDDISRAVPGMRDSAIV